VQFGGVVEHRAVDVA
jgi:hypothetical protein